jgi:hypothetical protein
MQSKKIVLYKLFIANLLNKGRIQSSCFMHQYFNTMNSLLMRFSTSPALLSGITGWLVAFWQVKAVTIQVYKVTVNL